MKKMEIKKTIIQQYTGEDSKRITSSLLTLATSLTDNQISFVIEEGTEYNIILTPKDILKLMTWLVGQEKHKDEDLIHQEKNRNVLQAILDVVNQKKPLTQTMDNNEFGKFIFAIKNCFADSINENTHTYKP